MKTLRFNTPTRLLEYCYRRGVSVIVFENLLLIKRRRFTGGKTGNREIARFAKKRLIQYGVIMALKYGFRVLLVDPEGTTNSREHDEAMKKHRLGRHTVSAYLIALRGLRHQWK